MLINTLKQSLVKVRKIKAIVENTTSTNPADEMAKMVLNEVTDSEKKLELTLTTMPKIHQERYEAANDMHERAQSNLAFFLVYQV